ncbi:unnamed protein product, partial [Didymodactylos carnosus]
VNEGDEQKHLILTEYKKNTPKSCKEILKEEAKASQNTTARTSPTVLRTEKSDGTPLTEIKSTYNVVTKGGLFEHKRSGADVPIFIRLHDSHRQISEPMQLKRDNHHKHVLESGYHDAFVVCSVKDLDGISKVELWHEAEKHDRWDCEFVEITENRTGDRYCFPVCHVLASDEAKHVILDEFVVNMQSCDEIANQKKDEAERESKLSKTSLTRRKSFDNGDVKKQKEKHVRKYTIRTKTGSQVAAGSTTPIHIRLIDDKQQYSEDLRLKQEEDDEHHFLPGAIDEFHVISHKPLGSLHNGSVEIWHSAPAYQGWYCEWLEIIDEQTDEAYCYPVQRWLDKGEDDKRIHITLTTVSNTSCKNLHNTMFELPRTKSNVKQSEYEIRTKTADKSLQGIVGKDTPNVFLKLYENGKETEPVKLEHSKNHKKPFQRHHTDKFELEIPTRTNINKIDRIDIWHDGKKDGWYCDYIEIKNKETSEVKCFSVHKWLDEDDFENRDSSTIRFSIANYQHVSCDKVIRESGGNFENHYYHVRIKTNLSTLSNDANFHIKLFGKQHETEMISLDKSVNENVDESNQRPFERDKIDTFEINTPVKINNLHQIEFYYNFKRGHLCVEWIELIDLSTGDIRCFPLQKMLTSTEDNIVSKLILKDPYTTTCEYAIADNIVLCDSDFSNLKENSQQIQISNRESQYKSNYCVRVKTGKKLRSGTNGWYCEWIELSDLKTGKLFCYEVDRWLNKTMHDGVARISLTEYHTKSCDLLPKESERKRHKKKDLESVTPTLNDDNIRQYGILSAEYKSTYNIVTKTKKGSFFGNKRLGLEADAPIFIRIHDKQGNESEPIQLKVSVMNRDPFESGNKDSFEVGSVKDLQGIDRLELYRDGNKNDRWDCEYIQVTDYKDYHVYCFPVNRLLGVEEENQTKHVILDEYQLDEPCDELSKKQQKHNISTTATRSMLMDAHPAFFS